MNTTRPETAAPATATMRATAAWFLAQRTLPRHGVVKSFDHDLRDYLTELLPRIEQLAADRGDDVPGKIALASVEETRRRVGVPEAAGLLGEVERVKLLARSVAALCDHYDALTGVVMCLACDRVIESGDDSVPYDQGSPSGSAVRSGRVHARCANVGRPRR
ncbi:DUF6415 family natural product biosynthesis protein [Streptomyces sp. NPDC056296]|uniref:DUF6415 family natural product biosynthesis protein n=1 Tax=Streptomyces sp. NPDC056296 TaxID=3345775 RepID=UPI0035D59CDC